MTEIEGLKAVVLHDLRLEDKGSDCGFKGLGCSAERGRGSGGNPFNTFVIPL